MGRDSELVQAAKGNRQMARRFKVFIPEPEWEQSHSALEDLADVEFGVPYIY